MPLSSSKLDHTICPDLVLVIEARMYERTSFSLPSAPPRILFGRGSQWRRFESDCSFRLFSYSWKLMYDTSKFLGLFRCGEGMLQSLAILYIEHASIYRILPRYALLVLYRACVLPIVDCGDIIFDNCTTTDSNLLESVQTAAAKVILGCLKTTSHEIILKDLGLTPLFIRRQFHILKAFRAILFGPCPSFLSTLAPKFF